MDGLKQQKVDWEDHGVYRRVPVRIMGAKHEPVQPYLIQPKMEQLLEDYRNNTDHIIPRLARFHIEFEGIHPFIDGKHSIGQMIIKSKYQAKLKIKELDIFLISNFIENLK